MLELVHGMILGVQGRTRACDRGGEQLHHRDELRVEVRALDDQESVGSASCVVEKCDWHGCTNRRTEHFQVASSQHARNVKLLPTGDELAITLDGAATLPRDGDGMSCLPVAARARLYGLGAWGTSRGALSI